MTGAVVPAMRGKAEGEVAAHVDAAPGPPRLRAEDGSIAPVAVAVIGVLLLLAMAANLVIATAVAHRRAQAAADLAALAGAQAWQQRGDATAACGAAATVAGDNAGGLITCRLVGDDVLAEVRVEGPSMFGHAFEIKGRARAGPESADSGG